LQNHQFYFFQIVIGMKMTHNIYEKFHASGKDLSKGTEQWKAAAAEATQEKDQFLSNTEVLLKNMIAV